MLCRQLPVGVEGFGAGDQRLLGWAEIGQPEGLVVQRPGQVGGERVGAGVRQFPVEGDGFGDGGQRLLAPAQVGQPERTGCSATWPGRG